MTANGGEPQSKRWRGAGWLAAFIVLAVVVVGVARMTNKPPQRVVVEERAVRVRVIPAPEVTVRARATGYGTVAPRRTWEAVAEVSGQIAWRSEALKDGILIKAGTELLRIDDSSYKLAEPALSIPCASDSSICSYSASKPSAESSTASSGIG